MFFFRTCLDCFQSTQNLYVDRLGNLKHCFSQKLEENLGFAEKQFFKLRKLVLFAHAWTASTPRNIYMWIDKPSLAKKKSGSKKMFFLHCSYETQTSPALQKEQFGCKNMFFSSVSCQICQLHLVIALARFKLPRCIQYTAKNALRIWGTLDLLWWKFVCIKK